MKVFLKGGLGNQLFQYAFAHTGRDKIHFVVDPNPLPHRPFMLSGLLETCQHVKRISRMSLLLRLKLRVNRISVTHNSKWPMPLITRISGLEEEAINHYFKHKYKIGTGNRVLYIGYFQNWGYVQNSIIHFKSELIKYLSSIYTDEKMIDFQSTIIIHVRRGDYLSPGIISRFGVLSSSYYQRSISEIKALNPNRAFKYVFLSEIKEDAQRIALQLKLYSVQIYGPEDLDAWQTLKVMSMAYYFIGANSTLSWWGAYLSSMHQGECILPSPWFKNWYQQIESDFYPPTTIAISSSFE